MQWPVQNHGLGVQQVAPASAERRTEPVSVTYDQHQRRRKHDLHLGSRDCQRAERYIGAFMWSEL